jgi:AraC-like DNA-binding protein
VHEGQCLYRSKAVVIADLATPAAPRCTGAYPLGDGTLIVARSGLFQKQSRSGEVLLDANSVAFARDGDCLCALDCASPCACTVLRYAATPPLAPVAQAAPVLSSSQTFLACARLIGEVRHGTCPVEARALCILRDALTDVRVSRRPEGASPVIGEVLRLINGASARRLPLREIAASLYISPFTLSRLFHKGTGVSLRRYMQRLRLRNAVSLMLDGSNSLTDIAIELGFYDEPHFSKAFHAEFGMTPHSVRRYWTRSAFC